MSSDSNLSDAIPRKKSKLTAAALALLLAPFGAHHYYLGSNTAGLLLLMLSCFCVGGVVSLVEGRMLLVMSDDEFDEKYNLRIPQPMEFVFQERH